MRMTKVLYGIALLPLLAGAALAEPPKQSNDASAKQSLALSHHQQTPAKQPMRLNDKQMDGVTAGMMFGLPSGTILFPGRLPSDPINWPGGMVPSCHIGPACL
jgi:hypothetical protein